jgi:Leucine-rich repeat (LRR) protein
MQHTLSSRVEDKDGFRGFVRYIGAVASSKSAEAIYCGVEWDIASRGKGDGSVVSVADGQTVRYFSVSQPGATASFVKPELLQSGVPMDVALDERYNDKTEYEGASLVSSSGKSTVPVLLVGDAKIRAQQALAKLQTATLRTSLVACISPGSLRELCPKLREVDLRGNLLSTWGSGGVSELGRELPNLRVLSLADNKLEDLSDSISLSLQGCFPQLRTLILTETGIGWAQASRLDVMCPLLEELHLAKNGISTILGNSGSVTISSVLTSKTDKRDDGSCISSSLFKNLKTLNLSDNKGLAWNEVYGLRSLESLSWLSLNDCNISQVWTLPVDRNILLETADASSTSSNLPFAKLEQLSLTGNKLSTLSSIDALDSFPALNTLRISHSDISDAATAATAAAAAAAASSSNTSARAIDVQLSAPLGPSEARQLVVARCPRITTFNGSEVRAREREDAEKAYARKLGNVFSSVENVVGGVTAIFGARLAPEAAEMNPYGAVNMGVFSGSGSTLDADAAHIAAAAVAQKTTLVVNAPSGFSKGSDSGVIKSRTPTVDRTSVFVTSPVPLIFISLGGGKSPVDAASAAASLSPSSSSSSPPPPYVPELDPWGLGASNIDAAGRLQRLFPRYFLMAARYELHAPAVHAAASAGTLASSVATVLLRSMAGGSCTIEPQTKKLPLSMEVGALRQLCAKLFKAHDATLLRLSFRDRSAGDAYPSLLEDETKPLSYYGVPCEGAEVLVEEIDPVEAARQRAAEEAKKDLRAKEQEAQGEALRRATEQGVQASKRAVI